MFGKKRKKLSSEPRQYQAIERPKQPVFSYSSTRKPPQAPYDRGSDNKGKPTVAGGLSWLEKLQYGAGVILLIAGIFYLTSLDSNAQIKIEGSRSFPRDNAEYEHTVQEALKSSVFNRSKLTLNSKGLEEKVKTAYPEIRLVEVKTSLLRHRPVILVQLAEPTARLVTPSSVYVLDEEGRALFDANQQTAAFNVDQLIPINDNSGHQIDIGKPAVTELQIAYVREVIGQFKDKNILIENMKLEGGGLELHVTLKDANHFIKFSFLADARTSIGAYIALREKNVPVSQYVDVRIPDRAYVK